MKKYISLIVALLMIMSMSVAVFAANDVTNGGTDTAEVKGNYKGTPVSTVYSVDISWSGLDFTYNDAYKGEWQPNSHTYINSTEAGWAESNGKITITNHSNTDITATPVYNASTNYETASMIFNSDALAVNSADNGVNGAAGSAVSGTITVTPNGSLPEGTTNAVIGTITITIN